MAFLLTGGRPPEGQTWAGGGPGHPDTRETLEACILWSLLWPRHQGREGLASFQPQARWPQPCSIHTCAKLGYSLQEIIQQKKIAFGSAIESSPLAWLVPSPVTPSLKTLPPGPSTRTHLLVVTVSYLSGHPGTHQTLRGRQAGWGQACWP